MAGRKRSKASKGFTDDERAAMKERVQELKVAARRGPRRTRRTGKANAAKIADMLKLIAPWPNAPCHHQSRRQPLAEAPGHGMPAYAKDGNVVCFFQSAEVQTRHADARGQSA
jgi:hypothetical protein